MSAKPGGRTLAIMEGMLCNANEGAAEYFHSSNVM